MLEVRGATESDLESAAECIAEAFSHGDEAEREAIREEVRHAGESGRPTSIDDLRVGVIDGTVASAVAVLHKTVHVGGAILSMGGIAAVCTRESHRGNGYNTAVLQDAIAHVERHKHDISLLYTGIHGYYERLGWRTLDHVGSHRVTVPRTPSPSPFRGAVRPMRPHDDLPAVREIYDATNADKAGPVTRDSAYWEHHSPRLASYHVAIDDDRVVAYLHDSGSRVEEIGYLPAAEGAACALVADALSRARAAGADTVDVDAADGLLPSIRALGCSIEPLPSGATMYRVTALAQLADKLLRRMSERLAASSAATWSGVVRLQSEVGTVGLKCGDGVVTRAGDRETPSITLEASHAETIQLVFGQVDPASLVTATREQAEVVSAVCSALFPPLTYRYYGPDTF